MSAVRSPGAGGKPNNLAVGDDSIKLVRPPAELINQHAIDCWKINSKILIKRGTYAQEDASLLLQYCNALAMTIICDAEILALGATVEAGSGGLKLNPSVTAKNLYFGQLTRAGSLLGLNPMSRTRFTNGNSDPNDEGNEFDEF